MGKRIRVQRRGRGTPTFKAAKSGKIAPVTYPMLYFEKEFSVIEGKVLEIMHEPGRGTPLACVELSNGERYYTVVPEGVYEGQSIKIGPDAPVEVGNVLPLGRIPEGTIVCNVEIRPGSGGKLARSSGAYATVVSHTEEGTIIKLPSGKTKVLKDNCRATIGVVAGSGRLDKPLLKAGKKYHLMRAKGHKYPRTRGRAMVAASHPYGSSKRGARKVTTVSRNAPPGQKVGLIAARSTGKKRRRRR
ncbi:50S ribosomal protein L2 [Candidatus Bathyarchaeota archaeon]|nr:MAG: 50S ribosomal protein L2 [Candidatus Bathyarchaeota archaeon]RLG98889.1 MAG: 50S ribosomal protein L2 [Candidatus Bathyarchaeota archaeon]RLI23015.1 MAG: 50S ribosomal protein L2 [Candidatus Bathyarchaeota archaeon]